MAFLDRYYLIFSVRSSLILPVAHTLTYKDKQNWIHANITLLSQPTLPEVATLLLH